MPSANRCGAHLLWVARHVRVSRSLIAHLTAPMHLLRIIADRHVGWACRMGMSDRHVGWARADPSYPPTPSPGAVADESALTLLCRSLSWHLHDGAPVGFCRDGFCHARVQAVPKRPCAGRAA